MATLQSFLNATQRLLHDANAKYWTVQTLIDAINTAQRRAVGDSSCNRSLQTIYLSGALELYGYGMVSGTLITAAGSGYATAPTVTLSAPPSGGTQATATAVLLNSTVSQINVTNGGSGYTSAPTVTIAGGGGTGAAANASVPDIQTLDTLNITVLWGTERIILNTMSFTEFQATWRSWQNYTQRPCARCRYGQQQWFIGPIPDQPYVSEWDTVMNPPDLVNLTDTSVVRYPYDECVPYYAAHTAKFMEQSYAEADKFLGYYTQKMLYARRSVMARMIPSVYGGG